MDWFRAVDGYCERVGPDYWSEPVNAVTNAAFLLAAAFMWPRVRGLPLGRLLCAILAAIGIGSWLFHTHAQAWAGLADVLPILLFILVYIFAASRDFLGFRPIWAGGGGCRVLPLRGSDRAVIRADQGPGVVGRLRAGAAADPDLRPCAAHPCARDRARHGRRCRPFDPVADLPHP